MSDSARLRPGDAAPDFTLPDADSQPITLSSYRGQRVVVYFYPAALTPGCTKQAVDFQDNIASFRQAGFAILGISPDKPAKLDRFRATHDLSYPLLSDPDRRVMTEWGAYGEKQLYGRTVVGVIRSTFIIDTDGTITEARYGVRATGHVAKLRGELGI